MSVLDDILRVKRDEVTVLHRPQTQDLLRRTALDAPPTRDFAGALRREDGTIAVIAEIKRRSPSKGELAPDLDPGVTAKDYERGGASAVSVLTDREFFGGTIEDLQTVRDGGSLPVLRKDFTIDDVQVYETRAIGADAILLILSALPDDAMVRDLQELAWSLGLGVLVEAHNEAELERGLGVGARILGVNARNLSTFDEHLDSVADLAARIPTDTIAVAESAIRRPEDAAQMAAAGFDAVLVGEALVRADDAVSLVGALGRVDGGDTEGSWLMRFDLGSDKIPSAWYNALPDLPEPMQPPLHPATREPVGPDDLAPLFPMALIGQEMATDPWIDIPGEVLDILRLWRPTPLVRATRLEQHLGTPARIYFKDESVSPAGSHKPNTAVPQAFYNKAEGTTRLTTETGAGQWGTALSFASRQFDLDCKVYMVRSSFEQKPYRRIVMETWGGEVVPSPIDDPSSPGSLGLAISDAVRDAVSRKDSHYSLGSVLNHVLLHQTVIGLEAKEQLALAGESNPDVVIGACGGGSNLGGIALPFIKDADVRLVAVEPSSCPTLTEGTFEYDFGDAVGMTPLLPMYTLGHDFMPPTIHAGGLRYHGDSAIISNLVKAGRMEAIAYPQGKTFEAAVMFANTEGKIPAPETGHAIRAAIDEALAAKETGDEKVILFNYSGHGLLDLSAYDDFLNDRLIDA